MENMPLLNILWQRFNEIQDIGVSTYFLEFLLRYLRLGLGGAEQDVEADGSSIQSRFLRHQGKLVTKLLYIELRNKVAVKLRERDKWVALFIDTTTYEDFPRNWIIEPLDQLDAE
jgi:hypothetical protein